MNKRKMIAYCVVILIWGFSSAVVSRFAGGCNPILVAGIVTTISLFVFAAYTAITKQIQSVFMVSWQVIKKLCVVSFLGIFLYPILFFYGIGGSSPLKANVLNYLWPLIAYISMGLIKWRQQRKQTVKTIELIAIAVGFVGVCFVLLSANCVLLSISYDDIPYLLAAFIGALSYGIYTALLNTCDSTLDANDRELSTVPRMLIMIAISELFHILLLIYLLIFHPEIIKDTYSKLFSMPQILFILIYSLINFSIAYFLWIYIWQEQNKPKNIGFSYYIPLLSTIIMTRILHYEMSAYTLIGLLLIVVSSVLIERERINSINGTFAAICIHILLLQVVSLTTNNEILENAKVFIQVMVALYAVFFGFVLNRTLKENQRIQELHNDCKLKISRMSGNMRTKAEQSYKDALQSTESDFQGLLFKWYNDDKSFRDQNFVSMLCELVRRKNEGILLSEWVILIALSAAIIILCFVIRIDNYISSSAVIVTGSLLCLCLCTLYDLQRKRKRLFIEDATFQLLSSKPIENDDV